MLLFVSGGHRGRARRRQQARWLRRAHRPRPTQPLSGRGILTATASVAPLVRIGSAGPFACVWSDPEYHTARWSYHHDRASALQAAPSDGLSPIVVDVTMKSKRHPLDSAALDGMVASLRRQQREGMRRRLRAQQRAETESLDADTYPGPGHALDGL
jgi:hypothetical protein